MIFDENIPTWVAASTDNKTLHIGSFRTGKTVKLTSKIGLTVINAGRVPFVVQEVGTGNYWGINLYGDAVPLALKQVPTVTQFSQDLFGLIDGNDAYVFGNWSTSWRKVTLSSSPRAFLAGRACLILRDGRDLYGFSTLFPGQPAKLSVPGSSLLSPVPGKGETPDRRNLQAYEIDTNKVALYSPYTNSWWQLDLGVAITATEFDYDKNSLLIKAPTLNRVWSYSALTGIAIPKQFKDLANVTTEVQDFGITFLEKGGDIHYFRAADTRYSTLVGRADDMTNTGNHANNCWIFELTDPKTKAIEWYGVSSSDAGAQIVAAGIGSTETVAKNDANDCCGLVVTDQALYGYSAFTNKWTVLKGYKGTVAGSDAEDFIARVNTDTHAYFFNPRDDKWYELQLGSGAKVTDTDQLVVVTEAGRIAAGSMQSLGWRIQNITGTLFQRGQEKSYSYSIHDRAAGGSTVYWYQSFADRWMTIELKNRVSDPKSVLELEDGILIVDGNTVHAFTGFGDLSSNWAAPNDNAAYHAVPGAFARFTASGPANVPAVFLLGLDRKDLSIPGFDRSAADRPRHRTGLPGGRLRR